MSFKEFRKITQDYCRVYDLPFLSRLEYKKLNKAFNDKYSGQIYSDVDVARFLDVNYPMKNSLTTQDLCKAKAALGKADGFMFGMNYICTFDSCLNIPVLTCAPEYPVAKKCGWNWGAEVCKKEKEVENTMTDTEVTRNYLLTRNDSIARNKRVELGGIFNIYANPQPKSYKDLIDWIKNDKFKLDTKTTKVIDVQLENNDGYYYGSFLDGIIWTAGKIPDQAGFDAADAERAKKHQAVKDVIYTSDAATALTALQAFESWTPPAGTKAN